MKSFLTQFPANHPKLIALGMLTIAVVFPLLVVLPSLWPEEFPYLNGAEIDTDPENMLAEDEPVRVFNTEMKKALSLNDIVVVGVVNDRHPDGVFNVQSLTNIYQLTEYAKTLRGELIGVDDPDAGVVEIDVIAPSTVDNIESGEIGVVRFDWLMSNPPTTAEEALDVRDKAKRLPFLNGTLVSEDGKAIAIYLPLTSKDLSYRVSSKLKEKIATFSGDDEYHITGLPVAEDTFGIEMFKQMALSAPAAMVVIFLLMLLFFRKLVLIISPLIIALVSVIFTMGLLIVSGNTIHIMSSMIPIFIMPIAVLDSVHILSEFFDRYQKTHDRRKTLDDVMASLFAPMLYTSLTSTAGFASLALTPNPPVQVFGIFVATGIMSAWFFTITFVPAYIMLLPESTFTNFGMVHHDDEESQRHGIVGRVLGAMNTMSYIRAKWVLMTTVLLAAVAVYGITKIQINDNPTRWFKYSHPIRIADRVLNEHFGGTYMAYLAFRAEDTEVSVDVYTATLNDRLEGYVKQAEEMTPEIRQLLPIFSQEVEGITKSVAPGDEFLDTLGRFVREKMDTAEGDLVYGWEEFEFFIEEEKQRSEVFKQPEALTYIRGIQDHLESIDTVGKSNSLPDIVRTIHRELFEGDPDRFSIPETSKAVAQCLITYESSHRPHDLYHFVTPDYRETSVWFQLKSGDNKDMAAVVTALDEYMHDNPPPAGITSEWFGLTYINVVWQEKMVVGMLKAVAGSFLVVLFMMVILFRSGLWALLSMIPLTVTIGLIYGLIGLVGKDYDMPVAVLSSMTLGLAVDFAIHFLARSRSIYETEGNWFATATHMFGEPARAISRNVIVVAVGFTPLLAATLVPYKTVGVLLAAILFLSGGGTLLILPSLIRYAEFLLFPKTDRAVNINIVGNVIVGGTSGIGIIAMNVDQFTAIPGITTMIASTAVLLLLIIASLIYIRLRKGGITA